MRGLIYAVSRPSHEPIRTQLTDDRCEQPCDIGRRQGQKIQRTIFFWHPCKILRKVVTDVGIRKQCLVEDQCTKITQAFDRAIDLAKLVSQTTELCAIVEFGSFECLALCHELCGKH